MSTDYDIYCRDCNEHYGFDMSGGNAKDMMFRLIVHRDTVAQIGDLLAAIDLDYYCLELRLDAPSIELNTKWFKAHAAHDLTVRDEYGRMLDECGERFNCPMCDKSHICRLQPKHEGDHSPKATA